MIPIIVPVPEIDIPNMVTVLPMLGGRPVPVTVVGAASASMAVF
jgi:hypothetical protein